MRRYKRLAIALVASVTTVALASCAATLDSRGNTRTYFGFTLGIESAPAPPELVFRGEPRYEEVEGDVAVVECPDPGSDLFVYGGIYYLYSAGYWYRCNRYDGTYAVVEVRRVPRPVLMVPEGHWRHRPHWDRGEYEGRERS